MSFSQQFLDAIAASGLTPPDEVIGDGKLRRFSTNGRPKDDAGYYVFHDDDRPAGIFGCNRAGVEAKWRADIKTEFTPEERAAWKAKMAAQKLARDTAEQEARQRAATTAAEMWERAAPANGHAYLAKKGIAGDAAASSARELDQIEIEYTDKETGERRSFTQRNVLLIPVKHGPRELVGLQYIAQDGDKHFLGGTPSGGGYTTVGKIKTWRPIVIVEGYATGLTVHLATGYCVVIAFNAGNLVPVAKKIRAAMPAAQLIIGADDDEFTEGNPGKTAAYEAATAVGARVVLPIWLDARDRGTDFNDLHQAEGLQAVADCFGEPEPGDEPDPADDEPSDTAPADPVPYDTASYTAAARAPKAPKSKLLIFAGKPMEAAKLFHDGLPEGGRIIFWRGEFYSWDRCRYVVRDKIWIEQRLYLWAANCVTERKTKEGDVETVAFDPTAKKIGDIAHALRAVCYADLPEPQCWIDERAGDPRPDEIIAFNNGFLHWPTRRLIPATDRLFCISALEFDYDPTAPAPAAWLNFLSQAWPDDPESISALGDMFGYMLTDDTSQQKMFMLIGPPRCGKGTMLRVLESLVGYANRVSPSLSGLGTQFGLQPLIGKRLAMISDARLSGKSDQQPIVENLLRITGEDSLSVDRKNIASWSGKLPTRFVFATNELPAFSDSSAALANRFILFRFTESFLGREDRGLTARLLAELPSIVQWALDGLERLQKRGYMIAPKASEEMAEDLLDQTSPMRAFMLETCVIGDGFEVGRDELFAAWKTWCTDQGRDHPGTKVWFGRHLSAAFPTIKRCQPRDSGTRLNLYSGARFKSVMDKDDRPY